MDPEIVYGKWITGGVSVSIKTFDRVSNLMSWMTPVALAELATKAGFEINHNTAEDVVSDSIEECPAVVPSIKKDVPFRLIGRPQLEKFINENIIDIVVHQEQYKRMGISFPGATILYGPPGCGKTYAIDRLSEYLGWKRFDIDSSSIASSYIHDTSKKIAEVFNAAIKASPSIIVIDEMEAFLSNRNAAGVSGTHHIEEVAEFLRRIPEATAKGVLIFAMTNMIDSIDPAILRRGRFDHIIEVGMASAEEIKTMLADKTKELPLSGDVDLASVADSLSMHPLSDVSFVVREAGKNAVKYQLAAIDKSCFDNALNMLPKKKEKNKIGF